MTTVKNRFIPCPIGSHFDEKENHFVMHSIAGGTRSICGKVVTEVIDHGPRGLVEVGAYTLGAIVSVALMPLKLATRVVANN